LRNNNDDDDDDKNVAVSELNETDEISHWHWKEAGSRTGCPRSPLPGHKSKKCLLGRWALGAELSHGAQEVSHGLLAKLWH
jgi:hypothetical protein